MTVAQVSGHGLWRSRWAAIGAAVAVALGAGGFFFASAADSERSNFVAVTAARVVDTRVDLGVVDPVVSAAPVVVQITGTVPTAGGSAVVVPTDATAVVVNVTAVRPTVAGYMTVRPGDAAGSPTTSSLNFSAGQVVANSVTVQLPAAGNIQVTYFAPGGAGTVDLLIDVVGYYVADGSTESAIAAEFYALMPPDNAATVAIGTDVSFPQDGPNTDPLAIARTGPSSFNLVAIGVYRVSFQVSVNEAGQLVLTLNGADLAYTVVGRATGTSQIVATALVETTSANSILTVRNSSSFSALSIAPLAGGTSPVSATLVIELVK